MKTVYFLDIDDCLIETSRLGKDELFTLEKSLNMLKIPKAHLIAKELTASFHRLYDFHQGKKLSISQVNLLNQYMDRLKELQTNIIHEFGQIKKWSREAFLYISAEKYGIGLNSYQIKAATFALWKAITKNNPFYPDALNFLKSLIILARRRRGNHNPFYLITSSDCRLIFDDKKEKFIYDPDYSKKLKLKRLKKFIDLGVPENNIFIGDPYDKPNLWIFKQALLKAKKDIKKSFESIMIGDSINNDLQPAKKAGIDKMILIDRTGKIKSANSKITIVKSLDKI